MIRALLLVVPALASAQPAPPEGSPEAAAPAKDAPVAVQVAREILTPAIWERTVAGIVKQTCDRFRAIAAQGGGSADEGLEPAVRKLYDDLLPYADVADLQAGVLAKSFSEPELLQLRDFYRSPLGQKVRDRLPEAMQETLLVGLQRVQKHQAKIDEALAPHFRGPPAEKQPAKGKAKPKSAPASPPR